MKVLILAGGYGTRLYPIIKDTPKALLEVAGKTLIDHTLDKFVPVQDIEEVVVVTNAKFHGLLENWAKGRDGKPFPIHVINDGTHTPEERLGAIGDVLFILDKVGVDTDWVVVGSDNLYDQGVVDFLRFAQGVVPAVAVGTYDVKEIASATKYGVIELDKTGRILSLEEKPKEPRSSLISMCLYYYPRTSLPLLKTFVDETHKTDTTGGYIQWLYKKTAVYGFKFTGKWYDIGSIESYNEAQKDFSK
jgi:glucose-1-phosphate thymidylyltransferase